MRLTKTTLAVLLLALLTSGSAYAWGRHGHGPHVRFGVMLGGPVWFGPAYYPAYYYPPVYYPPVPVSPPVYIEQGGAQAAPAPEQSSWYYCAETNAYYPYVKECARGWQRVSPLPAPG